jgi:putative peptide-modifying radical SAM enzyme
MLYFVVLTKECNLLCTYCAGGSDSPPKEIQYSTADLKSFLRNDSDPTIEFYGGEPLLRMKSMKRIMDEIPARFMIQTNGVSLDQVKPELLARLHTILVSIDGTREVTDKSRGRRVYDTVIRNSRLARERGFAGDLVARMTVDQGTSVYQNVIHLLNLGLFDHVHWQLNFGMFWKDEEGVMEGLREWIDGYNTDVSSLVRWWVNEMERSHSVPGIVPFMGLTNSLLAGESSRLRCGSGIDSFTIVPDGRVSACPVAVDFDFSMVGSIFGGLPDSLCGVVTVGEPCLSCEILQICGGRCLFVNKSQEMLRDGGYPDICRTVVHLVRELRQNLPQIASLINDGTLGRSSFDYPEFNNGCEIIP